MIKLGPKAAKHLSMYFKHMNKLTGCVRKYSFGGKQGHVLCQAGELVAQSVSV